MWHPVVAITRTTGLEGGSNRRRRRRIYISRGGIGRECRLILITGAPARLCGAGYSGFRPGPTPVAVQRGTVPPRAYGGQIAGKLLA
jgi:hypothetical protein